MSEIFNGPELISKLNPEQFALLKSSVQENCRESPIKVVKKSQEGTFDVFTLEFSGRKFRICLDPSSSEQVQIIDENNLKLGLNKSRLELFLVTVKRLGVSHLPEETSSETDVESELRPEDKQREMFEKGWEVLRVAMDREC
ncbi:MAG: hypothetical protein H7230_01220 [Candidatus Parcubacteria bacterium]|nr:hypothetical protein [Candidatus Paceibacterota bacterium]